MAEDDTLKHYIEKCRLEKWFEGVLDLAKQRVEEEVTEETQVGADMKHAALHLKELEDGIARKGREQALNLLHSKPRFKPRVRLNGLNGSIGPGKKN